MAWVVEFHEAFLPEFGGLAEAVQDEILAKALLLEEFGPALGRPHADTLYGSRHGNMKELRVDVKREVWHIAYAFDPKRKAILLVAGNKRGRSSRRFYQKLIRQADNRFDQHLDSLKQKE
jgi:hypothetical protein